MLSIFFLSLLYIFSLNASEEDYLKNRKSYLYYPETKQIAMVYVKDDAGKIVMRQGFAYYKDGTIAIVTVDNGSGEHPDDTTGITYKKISLMYPDEKFPYGDIPARKEEKVFDFSTNKEVIEATFKHYFSTKGELIKQEMYGSDNQLAYTREWGYDEKGNLVRQVNPGGEEIIFKYDEKGNKILIQGSRKDKYIQRIYDNENRLIQENDVHGDQVLSKHYRYDTFGREISRTDIYGNETNRVYDVLGNLIQIIEPAVEDENGKMVRPITMRTYKDGLPIEEIDSKGNVTKFVCSSPNKPLQIIYPNGSEECFEYNSEGDVTKTVGRDGYTTCFTRDYKGRITKKEYFSSTGDLVGVETFIYDAFNLLSETDRNGRTTFYTYDHFGRKVKQTKGNQEISFEYDTIGRVNKESKKLSENEYLFKYFNYDASNRVLEERVEDNTGTLLSKKCYSYSIEGLPNQYITYGDDGEEVTEIFYDSLGMQKIVSPKGGFVIEKEFFNCKNSFGQTVPFKEVLEDSGAKTVIIQDALYRVSEIVKKNPEGKVIQKRKLFYDSLGHLTTCVETVFDPLGNEKEYWKKFEYDSCHNCIKEIEAAQCENSRCTKTTYNSCGKKVMVEKPSGKKIFYQYNAEGLLISCYSSDQTISYSYIYDSKQRLISAKDELTQKALLRKYNDSNQLVEETFPNDVTIQYAYDGNGRLIKKILPDDSAIAYQYSKGSLRSIERISSAGDIAYEHSYDSFNQAGMANVQTLLDRAGKLKHKYDKENNLQSIEANFYSEEIHNNSRDGLGKVVKKVVSLGKKPKEYTYTYNALGQLLQENCGDGHMYSYDSMNHCLSKDNLQYTYNECFDLIKVGNTSFSYDCDGNLISDGHADYTYDAFGRLTSVQKGKIEVTYSYDALHRRMVKTIHTVKGEQKHCYVYDKMNEIGCMVEGKWQEFRVPGYNSYVAIEIGKNTYVPIYDNQGNISALLNHAGHIAEAYCYSAMGDECVIDGRGKKKQPINPYRFQAYRFDKDTGLYYAKGRYYNPEYGFYIHQDPNKFFHPERNKRKLYATAKMPDSAIQKVLQE